MINIGVTVSDSRVFPKQLEKIRSSHNLISIQPGELKDKIGQCDVIYLWNLAYSELKRCLASEATLPKQIFIARQGSDNHLDQLTKGKNVEMHYARGAFSKSISEFVLASIMMLSKNLHKTTISKDWTKYEQLPTAGSNALILGRGNISNHSKKLLEKTDINVNQISRSDLVKLVKESSPSLSSIDHIICCLPLEKETESILGDAFFSHFKNANFINISRGGVLNTQSLINALDNGNLRAATLDAFTEEPLPNEDRLWSDSRVVVSPHQSYRSPDWENRLHSCFINFIKSRDTMVTNNE